MFIVGLQSSKFHKNCSSVVWYPINVAIEYQTTDAPDDSTLEAEPSQLMTYNVYVGGSAEPILVCRKPVTSSDGGYADAQEYHKSAFPGRAAATKSIKTYQPHLIGLQEISLIRLQSPGDRIAGGTVPC